MTTAMIADLETPVEDSPRSGMTSAPASAPTAPLSPLLSLALESAAAFEAGTLTREPEPSIPAPIIASATYQAPYVPREYRKVTLDTFDPDISGTLYAGELELALKLVRHWTKAAIAGRRSMLALVGSQGNGKSTLLYGAVNALARHGVRVFSRPWYRLADELRYGGPLPWNVDGAVLEPHELRRHLYRAPVVVIDEVRATAGTAFDDTELAKFACHAWDEGIAVLITTNISPLAEVMGPAAADRFTVVTIKAPSRRQAE